MLTMDIANEFEPQIQILSLQIIIFLYFPLKRVVINAI